LLKVAVGNFHDQIEEGPSMLHAPLPGVEASHKATVLQCRRSHQLLHLAAHVTRIGLYQLDGHLSQVRIRYHVIRLKNATEPAGAQQAA
jgi:hypothetical protein